MEYRTSDVGRGRDRSQRAKNPLANVSEIFHEKIQEIKIYFFSDIINWRSFNKNLENL